MNKSGIIIANKPKGISTNKFIQKIRQKLKIKKIGHAGTLDPLATGVVVCLINKATKLSDFFLNENKEYEFEITLFKSTSTYDAEGEIVEEQKPFKVCEQVIKKVVNKFNGTTYNQTPPIFSAIKLNGKKLYEYARDKKNVDIKPRAITINELIFKKYNFEKNTILFETKCSKGTYIRSLAVDIAKEMNTIGFVSELKRIKSGNFCVQEALDFDEINEGHLISNYDALLKVDQKIIIKTNLTDVLHGKKINLNVKEDLIFISDQNKNIYACYERNEGDEFKCKRGGFND